MTPYKDLSREELLKEKENLEQQFAEIKAKGLKLDMSLSLIHILINGGFYDLATAYQSVHVNY